MNLKRMDEKMGAYIQAKGYALYEQKQSYGKSKKWEVTSSLKTGSTLAIIEGKGDHTDAVNESINVNCRYYCNSIECLSVYTHERTGHSFLNKYWYIMMLKRCMELSILSQEPPANMEPWFQNR